MSAPIFDIYIRVSDKGEREGDSYQSPREQERASRERIARLGGEVGRVVIEEDVSGGKRVKDRRLEELVQRVENHTTAGIVAFNVKRFARSVAEGAAAIKRIKVADGEFCDSYGNSTRENSLAINIYLAIGEDELEKLTDQWNRSRARAMALGKFVGQAPFGYVKVDGRLFEHDVEGDVVRGVFRRVAAGTLEDGIAYLNEHAPTRTRRRKGVVETYAAHWDTDNVRKLIRSRTYLGEHGKLGVEGYEPHAALVSVAIWQAAYTKTEPRARRRNGGYLLSGLVFCAECGSPLVGQLQSFKGRPETYRRYRCASRSCKGGSSCNADKLDAWVRGLAHDALADRELRADLMPDGVDDALTAWERATAERDAYADATSALSSGFAAGAAKRDAVVVETEREYRQLVGLAESFEVLPEADEVDDDAKLTAGLRVFASRGFTFALRRGRGSLDDRVVPFKHGKPIAGALAA